MLEQMKQQAALRAKKAEEKAVREAAEREAESERLKRAQMQNTVENIERSSATGLPDQGRMAPVIVSANATEEELSRIERQMNELRLKAEAIRSALNPEQQRQVEERALRERQEAAISKIISVSNEKIAPRDRKHKFKTLTDPGDKVGAQDIGIKMNGENIVILIGSNSYAKPASQYSDTDRAVMMDLIVSDRGFIFDGKTQESILKIALRNNPPELLDKLEELSRVQTIAPVAKQQQEVREVRETLISDMSPTALNSKWSTADRTGNISITTTRAKMDGESNRITGMKDFLERDAQRFVDTFTALQEVKETIKATVVSLSKGEITQEIANQAMLENKQRLVEIKAQQDLLCGNEKLAGFMRSAQEASLSPARSKNLKGKDPTNPDQVVITFAGDGDGLILNTFKNIKRVRELTKGVDELIKIAQESTLEQKQALAPVITASYEQEMRGRSSSLASEGSSRSSSPVSGRTSRASSFSSIASGNSYESEMSAKLAFIDTKTVEPPKKTPVAVKSKTRASLMEL